MQASMEHLRRSAGSDSEWSTLHTRHIWHVELVQLWIWAVPAHVPDAKGRLCSPKVNQCHHDVRPHNLHTRILASWPTKALFTFTYFTMLILASFIILILFESCMGCSIQDQYRTCPLQSTFFFMPFFSFRSYRAFPTTVFE